MRPRLVFISPDAGHDLRHIHDLIADAGSPLNALRYVERIVRFCESLELASERGAPRDDVRPGLRIVGFERRVKVAFDVDGDAVQILRVFYGGVDWERAL